MWPAITLSFCFTYLPLPSAEIIGINLMPDIRGARDQTLGFVYARQSLTLPTELHP